MRRILALAALCSALSASAALAAGSPSVSTGSATTVNNSGAVLNGSVNPEGTATRYAFQFGTTNLYGQETSLQSAGSGTTAQPIAQSLGGLVAGTTYHFRVIAINTAGTTTGGDATFRTTGTAPPAPAMPTASTGASTAVMLGGATLSGVVNPSGSSASYYFEFGPTSAYGFQTTPVAAGSGTAALSVNAVLSGLQSGTQYHYRLVATSAGGTALGADSTFTTLIPPPINSKLVLFGRTGFVAPSGVGGVLAGCIGQTSCSRVTLSVTRRGSTLGSRLGTVFIAAESGGVIHVPLNSLGRALVRRFGHLSVTVTLTAADGTSTSAGYTLVQFQ